MQGYLTPGEMGALNRRRAAMIAAEWSDDDGTYAPLENACPRCGAVEDRGDAHDDSCVWDTLTDRYGPGWDREDDGPDRLHLDDPAVES